MPNEPCKLMIVDDEYLIRELLKYCINWDEIGIRLVGDCGNAPEALELLDREMPDIILTDICMPCMDGLELSQIVTEKYPFIKVVILTGHDEFEYAQRSLRVGVSDFLLKPIDEAEIRQVVLKLREEIASERSHWNEHEDLKKQLAENLPYLREKFLNELLLGSFAGDPDELAQRLHYYQIPLTAQAFQVAVIELSGSGKHPDDGEEASLIAGMQFMDLVKQHGEHNRCLQTFFDYSQRIVMINNDPSDLGAACERLRILAQRNLAGAFCIGIGNQYRRLEDIPQSYREACNALKYQIIAGKNQVIHFHDLVFSSERAQWRLQPNQADLLEFYIEAGMAEKAAELVAALGDKLNQAPPSTLAQIRMYAANIVSLILNVITKAKVNIGNVFPDQGQPYEKIFMIDTLPEMKDYLGCLAVSAAEAIHLVQNKHVSKTVDQIRDYLIHHYHQNKLTLTGVAQDFFLNPSYLSRIFKQATGLTFVEFLTKIRMEKAIKLLKETDLKVYQIGERVGITDPHYFSICFKKYTGMSVNDYRKT